MVLWRTLVWKVLCGTRYGSSMASLWRTIFGFRWNLHGSVCTWFHIDSGEHAALVTSYWSQPGREEPPSHSDTCHRPRPQMDASLVILESYIFLILPTVSQTLKTNTTQRFVWSPAIEFRRSGRWPTVCVCVCACVCVCVVPSGPPLFWSPADIWILQRLPVDSPLLLWVGTEGKVEERGHTPIHCFPLPPLTHTHTHTHTCTHPLSLSLAQTHILCWEAGRKGREQRRQRERIKLHIYIHLLRYINKYQYI